MTTLAIEKYGCLTVLGKYRYGKRMMCVCRCDCGQEKSAREDRLKVGRIVSCGCKRSRLGRTHGNCRGDGSKSRTYRAWAAMKCRCDNPQHKSYANYGGRGIKVCDRWSSSDGYPNFLADMGTPSTGQSLDRIDNNGNYSPENCRWADAKTQQRNSRRTRMLTFAGETLPLKTWAERQGLERNTVDYRLKRGWSVEKALTTPSLVPRLNGG